MQELLPKVVKY
jgi:transposase InsO family protein